MRVLGITFAREGSVRIPGKNMKMFCGKPLLEWTLIQMVNTKHIRGFWFVTDSEEQAKLAEKYGFKVAWQTKEEIAEAEAQERHGGTYAMKRGIEMATKDAMDNKESPYDIVVSLMPTQPLRKPADIDNAVDMWLQNQAFPLGSGCQNRDTHFSQVENGIETDVIVDKTGKYWNTDGPVACAGLMQYMTIMFDKNGRAPPIAEMAEKIRSVIYPVEPWQCGDIDNQYQFDMVEHYMEQYILKGIGEKAYTDYKKHVRSEYGYEQYAANYNKGVENSLLPKEYRNSFFNHLPVYLETMKAPPEIVGWDLVELRKDDAGKINRKLMKHITARNGTDIFAPENVLKEPKPAIIIGSGPSLDDALPLMKDWKGAVFCSSSHASTLQRFGCDPSHLVAYDIQTTPAELAWTDSWEGRNTAMVTHPGMHPLTIDAWKGRRIYFRSMDTSNFFFTSVLPVAYGDVIPSQMFLFSCSAAAQMSIAKAMGYSPLFLVGMDFQAGRFKRWRYDHEKKEWICDPQGQTNDNPIIGTNGIPTDPLQAFYKRSFLCVWRIDHSPCLLTGDKSIITEIPKVDISAVIAYQGRGFEKYLPTDEQIDDAAEIYLAHYNQFVLRFMPNEEGKVSYRIMESHLRGDWEKDIRRYVTGMANELKKQRIALGVDIEANIARFKWVKERSAEGGPGAAAGQ